MEPATQDVLRGVAYRDKRNFDVKSITESITRGESGLIELSLHVQVEELIELIKCKIIECDLQIEFLVKCRFQTKQKTIIWL